jgi:hypothetical protein
MQAVISLKRIATSLEDIATHLRRTGGVFNR